MCKLLPGQCGRPTTVKRPNDLALIFMLRSMVRNTIVYFAIGGCVKIYKTKWFVRYARKIRLKNNELCDAIKRAEQGLVDADLGGGLIKLRVPRRGEGRSGGYRMLIAYRQGNRAIFLYGFAKNEQDNIQPDELKTLKNISADWLKASKEDLKNAVKIGILEEIE